MTLPPKDETLSIPTMDYFSTFLTRGGFSVKRDGNVLAVYRISLHSYNDNTLCYFGNARFSRLISLNKDDDLSINEIVRDLNDPGMEIMVLEFFGLMDYELQRLKKKKAVLKNSKCR